MRLQAAANERPNDCVESPSIASQRRDIVNWPAATFHSATPMCELSSASSHRSSFARSSPTSAVRSSGVADIVAP